MHNLFKAEIYKLKYSKELIICIIGLFVLGAIGIYYGGGMTGKESLASQSREMFGLMACTLFAITYIGRDFSFKTINHTLTAGHKRSKVLLGKYASYTVACIIILLTNYLFMGGLYSIFYGWGQSFTGTELYFVIVYIFMGIFFDLCIVSIPFFICVLIRNSSIAMALSAGVIGLIFTLSQMPWDTVAYSIASKDASLGAFSIIFSLFFIIITTLLYSMCNHNFKKMDVQ
ncbi:MAG: ABC transporter permease subunit [Romboutsia sp.]